MMPRTDTEKHPQSIAHPGNHRQPPRRLVSVGDDPKYHLDDPDVAAFTFCGLPTDGCRTGIVSGEQRHGRLWLSIVEPKDGRERRSCRGCLAGWVQWAVKTHRAAVSDGKTH